MLFRSEIVLMSIAPLSKSAFEKLKDANEAVSTKLRHIPEDAPEQSYWDAMKPAIQALIIETDSQCVETIRGFAGN